MNRNETIQCRVCGTEFVTSCDEPGRCPCCGGSRVLKLVAAGEPPTSVECERNVLLARIAELEARRPVVCKTCAGTGYAAVWVTDSAAPGGESKRYRPCIDCGQDGCGLGVRWA